MNYCTVDDVLRRASGITVDKATTPSTADVEAWITEQSGRIDQQIQQAGWHELPLDLDAEGAEPAAAILRACAAAGATDLLFRAVHDNAGQPLEGVTGWGEERNRLMIFCMMRLPGLPVRSTLGATL